MFAIPHRKTHEKAYGIDRRDILKLSLAAGLLPVLGVGNRAYAGDRVFAPEASDWRRFEIRTAVTLPAGQSSEVWLPVPALSTGYQRGQGDSWTGNAAQAQLETDPASGARYLHARFDGNTEARLELVSSFETRNRVIDWARGDAPAEDPAVLAAALRPSASKPLDGIVGETAAKITQGARSDLEKVTALYAWMVGNCYRNLDVAGCGPGNAVATLTTAGLGGKCADLNGLFVAMARASGVPARDVYGVRVAPSAFGYKQLGANGEVITAAQHCRSEVYLSGYGWVATDPADVLKVMRAESDRWIRDPKDPLVAQVNKALLGNWEGNWVGFNTAEDVALTGRAGRLPFLMYPQGSVGGRDLNELDAKAFSYQMTAKAV